jgi:hypothetical protein
VFLYSDQSYLCFSGFCNCMKQHMSIWLDQWHHCLLQTAEAAALQESASLPPHGPLCTVLAAPHLHTVSTKVITSRQGRRATEDGSSRFTQMLLTLDKITWHHIPQDHSLNIHWCENLKGLPLWSCGQSYRLQIQRSRVLFLALPDFLRSSGSGTGYTQPCEYN